MTVLTTRDHSGEWLSVREVAAELGRSEPTVRRRIRAGELPAVRLGPRGSGVRVPRAALTAWLWSEPNEQANEQGD
jgi:excisionase family DNA binding protein